MSIAKDAKIYVAGHLGLVGSALVRNLESKGYTNIIGRTINELDLMDQVAVEKFFAEEKPEYVILAAAKVGGIVANNTYRGQFIYENLQIQNNVIHQAYVHGVKKLVFLGSSCIYPKQAPQPMPEDCLLTSPLEYTNEPYAIAKIAGLKMCESYNIQYGTDYIAVMPTNLYGMNDNFDLEKSHVLPAMIRKMHLAKLLKTEGITGAAKDLKMSEAEAQSMLDKHAISSETVTLWGTGTPMREFLWSDDMADACVYIMESVSFDDLKEINGVQDEVRNTHINIGTGVDITIKDLAYIIKDTVGFDGEIVFDTDKPDGTMKKLQNVDKLHKLGWKHKVELKDGIKMMYEWYQQQ